MTRFAGVIGYGEQVEIRPDVWEEGIVYEKRYFGDVLQTTRRADDGGSVNPELSVTNTISIVADAYANGNFFKMRYLVWNGVYWVVESVEVKPPRLVVRLGGVYSGPKARAGGTP